MEWASRLLSLGALKSNWNVLRTPESSILISTWSFGGEETVGVLGQLKHTSFVKYGGGAVVNFSVQRNTIGLPQRMSNKLSALSLDTLLNMSASVPVNLGWECWLTGIPETGFLSVAELEFYTRALPYQGSTCQRLWARSSVGGIQAWDTSILFTYNPPPMENGE